MAGNNSNAATSLNGIPLAFSAVWAGIAYILSTTAVLVGVSLAFDLTRSTGEQYSPFSKFMVSALSRWDGRHFAQVIQQGYSYTGGSASNVAFFPAAPLLSSPLVWLGLDADGALILTSNAAFACCLGLLFIGHSSHESRGNELISENGNESLTPWVVSLWPLSFFMRAAYSEAVFFLFAAATLVSIRRGKSIWLVAFLAGATTATRPVGVAVIPACLWYFVARWRTKGTSLTSLTAAVAISTWGIAAYSAYLGLTFGDPLAFFRTQADWAWRGDAPVSEWAWGTMTLQPLWEQFVPGSKYHWRSFGYYGQIPIFNANFLNPIFVVVTVALVIDGARRKWISWPDLLFAITVIAIPYVLHAYKNVMLSQGRYMMACLPAFAVIARHLSRAPPGFQVAYFAISTALLVAYTALFSAGYLF